jgi:hypothetical protein
MKRRDGALILSVLTGLVFSAAILVACKGDMVTKPTMPPTSDSEPTFERLSVAPSEYQSGSVILSATFNAIERGIEDPTAYLDLDTGYTGDIIAADIRFDFGGGSDEFYSLDPVNGSLAKRVGTSEPEFELCETAIDTLADWLSEAFVGEYLCVLTNQGRLARVRVDALNPEELGSIQISFTTWDGVITK